MRLSLVNEIKCPGILTFTKARRIFNMLLGAAANFGNPSVIISNVRAGFGIFVEKNRLENQYGF